MCVSLCLGSARIGERCTCTRVQQVACRNSILDVSCPHCVACAGAGLPARSGGRESDARCTMWCEHELARVTTQADESVVVCRRTLNEGLLNLVRCYHVFESPVWWTTVTRRAAIGRERCHNPYCRRRARRAEKTGTTAFGPRVRTSCQACHPRKYAHKESPQPKRNGQNNTLGT